ncbi:MAG: hypothetical protein ACR2GY_05575, partial [Phycisphaerales bacterium]
IRGLHNHIRGVYTYIRLAYNDFRGKNDSSLQLCIGCADAGADAMVSRPCFGRPTPLFRIS